MAAQNFDYQGLIEKLYLAEGVTKDEVFALYDLVGIYDSSQYDFPANNGVVYGLYRLKSLP